MKEITVNLGGIVPLSTVDWPGRAAIVLFLRGCPLRCPHCHNFALQSGDSSVNLHSVASKIASLVKGETIVAREPSQNSWQIDLDEAAERASNKPFVDALVLSGGEPLMQSEPAERLFRLARSLQLCTGLETSGCYPERLRRLLERDLVDKVFLDIKAALQDPSYKRATGFVGVAARVKESLMICMERGVALEVRTTVFPEMPASSELEEIACMLSELKNMYPRSCLERLVLQQGLPREGEERFEPVSRARLQEIARSIGGWILVGVKAKPDNFFETR
ncbi:MAG TPA: radical SAM protein [Methanothrix sp.]|nr:radical SAM protein [Methanothrix sp.]